MKEYLTEAIILGVKPRKEHDLVADLYTKDLGRLRAKVASGHRFLSKFSPHLNVLNLVTVRLAKKGGFIITDVLAQSAPEIKKRIRSYELGLELIFLTKSIVPELNPDLNLWYSLSRAIKEGRVKLGNFLKILGYDSLSARCEICGLKNVTAFSLADQNFLCSDCRVKFPRNKLLYF